MAADLMGPGDLVAYRGEANPRAGHAPVSPATARRQRPAGDGGHHGGLPFVGVLYLIAYIDRQNVGYAKLQMVGDLGISEYAYGLGLGLFGLWYLPRLKRGRARAAQTRAQAQSAPRDSGSNTVSSTETPGRSTRS